MVAYHDVMDLKTPLLVVVHVISPQDLDTNFAPHVTDYVEFCRGFCAE